MLALAFSHLAFGPLLAAAALLVSGRRLGVRGAATLLAAVGLGQLASLGLLFGTLGPAAAPAAPLLTLDYGLWFGVGELRANWGFLLDGLALPMASLVVAVSLVTQAYSFWYLAADPALVRFQSYLNLFTAAMVALVTADNFAVFFLGWEGVGCCSYLLIGFWCTRPEARSAALKAVAVNRVGDAALLAAVGLLASLSGSLAFGVNFGLLPFFGAVALPLPGLAGGVGLLPLANGLLLVAIGAKSAQLGLHGWLADAMEGPTPVSALIHAATMVTAGIYLALRCSPLFALTPAVGAAMALLGGATALFGAAVAAAQWDLKKIIAYSTASQLGYMLCGCGLGGYHLAFHHLVAHGFFKALLFLAAGVLIHALGGEQDLRRLGGLLPLLPATTAYLLVGFGALLGLPGTSGSYSKERLLELASGAGGGVGAACYTLLLLALVGTAFYSAKTLSYALLGTFRGGRAALAALAAPAAGPRELPRWLPLPLGALVLLTLATESLYAPYSRPLGGAFLAAALGPAPGGLAPFADALATPNRWLPLAALALGAAAFAASEALAGPNLRRQLGFGGGGRWERELLRSWQRGFGFDGALCRLAFGALRGPLGAPLALEKGLLEWMGPYGLGVLANGAARRLELLHLGRSAFGHLGLLALAFGGVAAAAALLLGQGVAGGSWPPPLRRLRRLSPPD
jgi:NADH-quinone oxidoreductase subunit L